MLKRDNLGIIVQHSHDPSYSDGGDSSNRTALLALSGSKIDSFVLPLFVQDGLGRRHPSQAPYDDPRSWTRDQLIPTIAALAGTKQAKDLFWSHAKRLFICQNSHNIELIPKKWYQRDILSPSHVGHLILSARIYQLYSILPIYYLFLLLDLVWNTKAQPKEEQNQFISMLVIAGKPWLKLYKKMHPSYQDNLYSYWCGWRDQKEIADAIISKVEKETK